MLSRVSADDVIVVTITSGTPVSRRRRKRDNASGVVVSVAIPSTNVDQLSQLISETNSSLYSPQNGQLATLIDKSYPIRGNAVSSAANNGAAIPSVVTDPNSNTSGQSTGGSNSGGGLSKASLIGICVSVGVVIYCCCYCGCYWCVP